MSVRRGVLAGMLIGVSMCAGACRAPLPVYPTLAPEASLAVMGERASGVRTFSGAGSLTVRDPERGSVTLEAAIVARHPDQVRVRAWKLGRSVADITLDADAVEAETDRRVDRGVLVEGVHALRTVLLGVDEGFYRGASPDASSDGGTLLATGTVAGSDGVVRAEIDRATLTLRSLSVGDAGGAFTLDRYREVDGTVWPMRIRATSGAREAVFRFDWVEFNTPLAPGALPDRAEPAGEPGGGA